MRKVQHDIKINVHRGIYIDTIVLRYYDDYSRENLMKLVQWIEGGLMGQSYYIDVCTYIDQDLSRQNDDKTSKCADCTGGYCEEECMEVNHEE